MTSLAEASRDTESIDAKLRDARTHLKNAHLGEAAATCAQILEIVPDNVDALYTLAVAQRMQRQIPHALKTLEDVTLNDEAGGALETFVLRHGCEKGWLRLVKEVKT